MWWSSGVALNFWTVGFEYRPHCRVEFFSSLQISELRWIFPTSFETLTEKLTYNLIENITTKWTRWSIWLPLYLSDLGLAEYLTDCTAMKTNGQCASHTILTFWTNKHSGLYFTYGHANKDEHSAVQAWLRTPQLCTDKRNRHPEKNDHLDIRNAG